ncbi:hypothetical protein BS47DRAFT_1392869 [Hydnum rufescens UP504]|uniref:Uncharacterized protein n=1 Tax=Hydnum rufescens UP504 TaxID=1448309 RepID=A0A9P6AYC7_9AGAM|nr:hypothetical protein BS47DRAFT_1392869 [Hydnum rufescens UP504]
MSSRYTYELTSPASSPASDPIYEEDVQFEISLEDQVSVLEKSLKVEHNRANAAEKHVEILAEMLQQKSFSKAIQETTQGLWESVSKSEKEAKDARDEADYWKQGLKRLIEGWESQISNNR